MDSLDDITGVEKYLVLKATQARTPISASFELGENGAYPPT